MEKLLPGVTISALRRAEVAAPARSKKARPQDDTIGALCDRLARPASAVDFVTALGVVAEYPLTASEAIFALRQARLGAISLQTSLTNRDKHLGERLAQEIDLAMKRSGKAAGETPLRRFRVARADGSIPEVVEAASASDALWGYALADGLMNPDSYRVEELTD